MPMERTRPSARATTTGLLLAALLASAAGAAVPVGAAPGGLDAKKREAARLEAEIERQGERLSVANEQYNEAALERAALDGKIARTSKDIQAAQDRWQGLKTRLGRRVRLLYMHPGAWAGPLLDARSLDDLSRRRILSSSVLTLDTDLLLQTQRARAEVEALRAQLVDVRGDARSRETELAAKRAAVDKELKAQKALLGGVQGEIAQLIEADRQRRLQEAARRAAVRVKDRSPGLPAPANVGPVRSSASKAVATAAAQIGKPYEWGAAGPDSFDCSGLTMYAWASAGVSLPHSSRAQYSSLPKVPSDQIQPGDLLFFGNPIHHVGIYEGGGVMIGAPQTGETVRRASIYRKDFVGATRP